MSKPSFKKSAAEIFISAADEPQAAPEQKPQAPAFTVPKGYQVIREYKTARMQLLVRPTTKAALKRLAAAQGDSLNDYVNKLLDTHIEEQGEL